MSDESRDEAIREAKRYVRDVVQNDWSFEFSAKPGAPPPKYPANPEPTEVLEWRIREYDSSGSELEPQFSPVASPGPLEGGDAFDGFSGALSSVSSEETRHTERRRKRRRQMEEEMSWNEGLRTWVERRDAWSGAQSRKQVKAWERKQRSVSATGTELEGNTATPDSDIQNTSGFLNSNPVAVPATRETSNLASKTDALNITRKEDDARRIHDNDVQPSLAGQITVNDATQAEITTSPITEIADLSKPLSASAAIPAASPSTSSTSSSPSSDTFHDPLIPVVPSLISTSNPIRAAITPAMYPSIYSKVVIQGLTPTVPINLADMTNSMVQGWKADGQWPPKPQNLVLTNDAIVRPTNTSASKHPDTPAIPPSTADKDRNPPSSPESKRKSSIASTVRKVLHFSGFHPHPFHRRGSSSQHLSHPEDLPGAAEGSAVVEGDAEQADK
ncbi:DUF4050 domain-containing protein [Aspergillus puulaauensis]|uniref:Gag1-like clamp domain-containing protein n=1 Tax=Aspergillus puulaauensis TaxID=1220207 RepID=A0A7R7XRS5_9EURO|nr:uncharacterized protein APUU_51221S [Aspergillus puulaauensis]BCS26510.1 hypothetical protein APUU_51221S [Aspergillus puulaauensis]